MMSTYASKLKTALARARVSGNIDFILPVLLESELLMVCKRIPTALEPIFYLQHSPDGKRWCVTASDSAESFKSLTDIELVKHTGRDLMAIINPSYEIVIVYPYGGDYLTTEQLDYFRPLAATN